MNFDNPAFAVPRTDYNYCTCDGLSKREYAAIHLRVAESGDAVLDAMIRKANRMRVAEAAMQAYASDPDWRADMGQTETARTAVFAADALLDDLERSE